MVTAVIIETGDKAAIIETGDKAPEPKTKREVAIEYFVAANRNREEAEQNLLRDAVNDTDLVVLFTQDLFRDEVHVTLRLVAMDYRRLLMDATGKTTDSLNGVTKDLQRVLPSPPVLMGFPLSNGKQIDMATRDELLAEASRYGKPGLTNMIRAVWLRSVAAKVGLNQRVRDAVTEEVLSDLYGTAELEMRKRLKGLFDGI